MGLRSLEPCDAGDRAQSSGLDDRRPSRPHAARRGAAAGRLTSIMAILALAPGLLVAEPVRIATWGADISRDGPGLLLRDILSNEDQGIDGVAAVLADVRPDILLLTDMDWDGDGAALTALAERLAEEALDYPYRLALAPNAGLPSGLDLDGNGRLGEARDAQGYGRFMGEGGWRCCRAGLWAT